MLNKEMQVLNAIIVATQKIATDVPYKGKSIEGKPNKATHGDDHQQ
jgi:hypothetical protein